MRNECNIIRDILPLYIENMVSDDTAAFVEDHLKNCAACRAELEKMKIPDDYQMDTDIVPLEKLKRKMTAKKIQTIVFTAILVLAIAIAAFAALDAPKYFPYSQDLLMVNENTGGGVTITFNDNVTDYRCYADISEPEAGQPIYRIEAWTTFWGEHFSGRGIQSTVIQPTGDSPLVVYYMQNNGDNDICIYNDGTTDVSGAISLPSLTLGYCLIFATIILVLLVIAWFIFKKSEIRVWIIRAVLLPVSYMIGHFTICGFATVTFSLMYDFPIIVFVSLLIYCALLLAYNIYLLRKEIREASGK